MTRRVAGWTVRAWLVACAVLAAVIGATGWLVLDTYRKATDLEVRLRRAPGELEDAAGHLERPVPRPAGLRPLTITEIAPTSVLAIGPGHYVAEFERAVFGTLALRFDTAMAERSVSVALSEQRIDGAAGGHDGSTAGQPAGFETTIDVPAGRSLLPVPIAPRRRPEVGELPAGLRGVMPFRFVEIRGTRNTITRDNLRQWMVHYPIDVDASHFDSSDQTLDAVWKLSKHTLVATSYASVFVDGNRERKPYEADAYVNQLGWYGIDRDPALARHTLDHLLENPTWPTEWVMQAVQIAYADYMHSGDLVPLRRVYDRLKPRLLLDLARDDGLVSTRTGLQTPHLLSTIGRANMPLADIVDWPASERDNFDEQPVAPLAYVVASMRYGVQALRAHIAGQLGRPLAEREFMLQAQASARSRYEMPAINTVVNAWHFQVLNRMVFLARALGRTGDAERFEARAKRVKAAMQRVLVDPQTGLFRDGEGSAHHSLHANMYALAFGLVEPQHQQAVVEFIKRRGMACSVYGAQYLLESLYHAGEAKHALSLLTSKGDRSWWAMMARTGSTMTTEAWSALVKPDMDWNHAWGTAPANIVVRWLMGVRPLEPGYRRFIIQPQPGALTHAAITLPLPVGSVSLAYRRLSGSEMRLTFSVPPGTAADVYLPSGGSAVSRVHVDGVPVEARVTEKGLHIGTQGAGTHEAVWSQP